MNELDILGKFRVSYHPTQLSCDLYNFTKVFFTDNSDRYFFSVAEEVLVNSDLLGSVSGEFLDALIVCISNAFLLHLSSDFKQDYFYVWLAV